MPLLTWNSRYSVLVPAMDVQHQKLVALINRLHDAMRDGSGNQHAGAVLEELMRYATTHFAAEERLMRECGYRGLAEHQKLHQKLTEQAAALLQRHRDGSVALSVQVSQFLRDWLTTHILQIDRQYGEVLGKRQPAA